MQEFSSLVMNSCTVFILTPVFSAQIFGYYFPASSHEVARRETTIFTLDQALSTYILPLMPCSIQREKQTAQWIVFLQFVNFNQVNFLHEWFGKKRCRLKVLFLLVSFCFLSLVGIWVFRSAAERRTFDHSRTLFDTERSKSLCQEYQRFVMAMLSKFYVWFSWW